jgi:hypothetical protein
MFLKNYTFGDLKTSLSGCLKEHRPPENRRNKGKRSRRNKEKR